jgi:hypothetical protein
VTRDEHVDIDPVYGCMLWRAGRDVDGYPLSKQGGSRKRAHIAAYERVVGSIPAGLELDHLCRRRACVNALHLEPVTREENERRKSWRYRARRKTCPHGHDMCDALVTPEGGRVCRRCRDGA